MPTRQRIHVVVNTKAEARAIERALTDPEIRAFVIVCGVLDELPSKTARRRVLTYIEQLVHDPDFWTAHAAKVTEPAE